ncbi:MAG TPA: long-chain fatty acid--CoA ligase [Candidatus Limnocylindria bacterium]|nr:long-chain fatty acid--CoA ligase [Candidatus Limnocylindria bacterium]
MAQRIAVTPRAGTLAPKYAKNYDTDVPSSLDYPAVSLHALLDQSARVYPDSTATIFFNAKKSYRELFDDAKRFAAGLRALGVRQGDRVAVDLPNCPQFLIAFFGALRLGAVVVPCNPLYTPPELRHQLADSGAETIVVLSRGYPVVKAARDGTKIRNVIVTNIKEEMPPVLRTLFTIAKEKKDGHRVPFDGDPGAIAFRKVLSLGGDDSAAPVSPNDIAVLQYTGGTTGTSKGAMLSHRALVANTLQCAAWFGRAMRDGKDAVMGVMPLFHVYGLTTVMNFAVLSGGAIILEPQLDLEHVMKDIQRHKPKLFHGAPRIYNAINNSPLAQKYDLRSITACISGSAPLLMETARRFRELTGANLVEGYGLTEASPVTHCNPVFDTARNKVGTIGLTFPDTETRIVDLETGGRDLATGEAGELLIRGPQLMDGYYNNPEETAQTLKDGWLHTGDIATIDADGYVAIVDRKKELIIVSGFNVYPREVEETLATHPAVLEGAAIGVPHPIKGEEVKAFVVLKPGRTATADELIAFCREQLAPFKVPRAIEFRDALPKTLIGKVLRRQLAEDDREQRASAP